MARIRTTPGTPPFYRRLTDGTRRIIGTEWQEIDDNLISAGMRRRQELEIVATDSSVNMARIRTTIEIQTPEDRAELRDEPETQAEPEAQTEAEPEPVDEPEHKAKSPKKRSGKRGGHQSRG